MTEECAMRIRARQSRGWSPCDAYDCVLLAFPSGRHTSTIKGVAGTVTAFGGDLGALVPGRPGRTNSLTIIQTGTDTMIVEIQGKGCVVGDDGKTYRIRRLTPRECMRLMGYTDEEIDRIDSSVVRMKSGKERKEFPDSAMYKFAGNSVVVDCFAKILGAVADDMGSAPRKGIEDWQAMKKSEKADALSAAMTALLNAVCAARTGCDDVRADTSEVERVLDDAEEFIGSVRAALEGEWPWAHVSKEAAHIMDCARGRARWRAGPRR